jgi:hypothetical protein
MLVIVCYLFLLCLVVVPRFRVLLRLIIYNSLLLNENVLSIFRNELFPFTL